MLTPTIWKHGNTETTGSYQSQFTTALQTSGRMIYARIYQNGSLLFDESTINNLTISFDGGFLKSVMRVVEIELNGLYYLLDQEFSSIQIGVSADQGANIYYIDYGKFIVGPENEQSIETNTTKITCYDETLKSMVPFTLQHTYTVNTTNRNFLYLIAQELGITLGSTIPSDGVMALYRNHETYTTQNTYRDVLDDFAEILGCCLTIKNGVLERKTGGSNVWVITEEQLKKINFKEPFNTITSLTLSRMPQEDNVSYPDNPSEGEAVKLENNLLVEGYQPDSGAPDRTAYLQPVYTALHSIGMFYPIELESFGFCIYEPMDRLEVQVRDYSGNLVQLPIRWMNNTIKVGPGLDEDMECERPEFGETDYTKSSSSAIAEKNTYLYVDKVGQTIEAHVESVQESVEDLESDVDVANGNIEGLSGQIQTITTNINTVQQTAENNTRTITSVRESIGNDYYTKTETSALIEESASGITEKYTTAIQNGINSEEQRVTTMIRRSGQGIAIGLEGNQIEGRFDNDSLDFVDTRNNDNRLAWVDANEGLGGSALAVGDPSNIGNRWRIFTRQSGTHLTFTRHS